MISKLPQWVRLGGGVLALAAGMINAIAFLSFSHQAATHVTGVFSHLSIALFAFDSALIRKTLFIILCFFSGAVLSGVILRDAQFKMGRRYGFALAVECFLLLLSTWGFQNGSGWGESFACMAAGLQNAMVSTYSGAIVRTTHLTGIVTDLGVLIGQMFQGIAIDRKRIELFLILIISFTAGGLLGALAYSHLSNLAMLVPAFLVGSSSAGYILLQRKAIEEKPALF